MSLLDVYEHDNYGGTRWSFSSSTAWVGPVCNDKMSSFKLAAGRSVIFYLHANYEGGEIYRASAPLGTPIECAWVGDGANDKMSSFRLFSDSNFRQQI